MKRSTIFFVIFLAAGFFLLFPQANPAIADNSTALPAWQTAGTGTHFQVSGSSGTVSLDSSIAVNLALESFPNMVTVSFDAASTPASAQITVSGLLPSTTYFKSQDGYNNQTVIVTDGSGTISFAQQIDASPHIVIVQPNHATIFIRNDSTGGDCTTVGSWDSSALTCTLTTDISGTVEIDSNNITLDGNGHTISGGTIGVFLVGISSATIKNATVSGFNSGIRPYNSSNDDFLNNNVSGNFTGFYFSESSYNTIQNNTASNNAYFGIYLDGNNNNNISGNTFSNNGSGGGSGIFIYTQSGNSSNNVIDSNVIDYNGRDGLLFGGGGNLVNYAITNNDIEGNGGQGLNVPDTFSGVIYHNNIINNANPTSVFPPSANLVFSQPLPIGGNHWSEFDTPAQGCVDSNGNGICDSSFIFTGGQDNFPWVAKSGWKLPLVSSLNQYKSDAITPITEGGTTTEDTVVFGAILQFSSTDQLQLQVEYTTSTASSPFTGMPNGTSASVNPGSGATITVSGLQDDNYRWQARAVNMVTNAASDWQEFGTVGNTDFVVQHSTPQDTTAPTITGTPGNMTVEAISSSGADVSYTAPTATDLVDGTDAVTCLPASGSTFPLGTTAVTCTAEDVAGNTATSTFSVTVQDKTAPVITAPIDQTFEATGASTTPALALVLATATDTVDPSPTITYTPSSFPVGDTTVTWTATDASGNKSTATSKVTIKDTTVPVITLLGSDTVYSLVNTPYVDAGATALDNVDGDITSKIVVANPVNTSKIGSYTVTYNVADSSGNHASQVTRTVKVVCSGNLPPPVDTIKPVIFLIGANPQIIEVGTAYSERGAIVFDNRDFRLTPVINSSNVNTSRIGSYTVTYNAVDSSGNRANQVVRTVKVVDTIKPVIILIGPNPQVIEVGTAYSELGANVSDNYDTGLTPTINASSVNTSRIGSYIVTYNAVDSSGNRASQRTRTVKVVTKKGGCHFGGFQPPIEADGSGIYKLGRTLPIKFRLTDANGNAITSAIARLVVTNIENGIAGTDPVILTTSTHDTGNLFRVSGGQYIYNFDTSRLAVGTWQIKAMLDDGNSYTVPISLR